MGKHVHASTVVVFTLISLLWDRPCEAYFDPGTTSFLLQLLAAALLGFSLTLRRFWAGIRKLFKKNEGTENTRESNAAADDRGQPE